MQNREKIKLANQKQNDDYESNLKLHLDAAQSELRIILSSSMQNQVNNIKTILWINMLFIAISIQLPKELELSIYTFVSFYSLVILSVALLLIALLIKRYKYYGTIETDYAAKIYNSKFQTMDMLATLLGTTQQAIQKNKDIMKHISEYMHLATWLTFLSLIIPIIAFTIINYKGGNEIMAEDKNPPRVPTQQTQPSKPVHEAEERTFDKK